MLVLRLVAAELVAAEAALRLLLRTSACSRLLLPAIFFLPSPCCHLLPARAIERETQRKQRAFGARAGKVVTEVKKAKVFYPAEKYHQRKLQKGGQSAEKECTVAVRCYG